jgi:SAM-dependent methyltransferase
VALGQDYFDAMFQASDDPWGFKSRWYETRKRALSLAALPQARYTNGFEPGCANGELSVGLAARCDRLLCSDGSDRAVELARARLAGLAHVTVRQAWVPQDWPDGQFDLIVISELGYFLTPASLDALGERALSALAPGGTLLACHWRRPIGGCDLTGDDVHARLARSIGLPHAMTVLDDDFRLDLWFGDGRSLAQLQGLVDEPAVAADAA